MGKNEIIGEMYANFTNIIAGLKALRKGIPMRKQVANILWSLTNKYETKMTAIEEAFNITTLKDLIINLQTYEVKLQTREAKEDRSSFK